MTLIQKVALSILVSKQVYKGRKWNKWANDWLSGKDRSYNSAVAAYAEAAAAAKGYIDIKKSSIAAYAAAYAATAATAYADAAYAEAAYVYAAYAIVAHTNYAITASNTSMNQSFKFSVATNTELNLLKAIEQALEVK